MLFLLILFLVLWSGAGYWVFRSYYAFQELSNFCYELIPGYRKNLFYLFIGPVSWLDILITGRDINNG